MIEDFKPLVWSIAASDSGGCSGVQADIRTLTDLGTHTCTVITAITAQHSHSLNHQQSVDTRTLRSQLEVLRKDLMPAAIKIGVLPTVDCVQAVANTLASFTGIERPAVILDSVFISSSGKCLASPAAIESTKTLFPYLDLLTPNHDEAEILTGEQILQLDDVPRLATLLLRQGVKAVLIKGGHTPGNMCCDYFSDGQRHIWLSNPRQSNPNDRATGCVLSSAIAAFCAQGKRLGDAVVLANAYLQQGLRLAKGLGPLHKRGAVAAGGWPKHLADYPWVTTDYLPIVQEPSAFAPCDTFKLGLYPVVDSLAWIKKLLALGVKTLQLRIKDRSPAQTAEIIKAAITAAKPYRARLFINDYWQLAIEHGAYGVHLGQEDLYTADLNQIRTAGLCLGISTHSELEWARAISLKPSYVAIGAIYPTHTKDVTLVGVENLQRWATVLQTHVPLVAIGGINPDNSGSVLACGVGSIAVVSAITATTDTRSAVETFNHLLASHTPEKYQPDITAFDLGQ